MTALVIGGTGTVGPYVVRALTDRGAHVRVLTRRPEQAAGILPAGVEIHPGDPGRDDDVLAAAADASAVLVLTAHSHDMADLQLRIIRALRRTPARIVKISGTRSAITPDGPYACRQHWEIEQVLAGSGRPFVILRPNSYMQTLIDKLMLPAVRATGILSNPIGGAGISLIHASDVGGCAAEALLDPRWEGSTLALTGPRPVTYREIADLLQARTGQPVPVRDVTPAAIRAGLEQRGMAAWEAEHFEEMYQLFSDGESEFVTDDVRRMLGRAPISVEEHLTAHSDVLTGSRA